MLLIKLKNGIYLLLPTQPSWDMLINLFLNFVCYLQQLNTVYLLSLSHCFIKGRNFMSVANYVKMNTTNVQLFMF